MTVDEMVFDTKIEMVRGWLVKHGYTGLVCTDAPCGCELDDIDLCAQDNMGDCEPGHIKWCKDCSKKDIDDCEFLESNYCVRLKKEVTDE